MYTSLASLESTELNSLNALAVLEGLIRGFAFSTDVTQATMRDCGYARGMYWYAETADCRRGVISKYSSGRPKVFRRATEMYSFFSESLFHFINYQLSWQTLGGSLQEIFINWPGNEK